MPTGGKRKGEKHEKNINLQLFAEGGDGNVSQNAGEGNNNTNHNQAKQNQQNAGQQQNSGQQGGQQSAGIDYDKIQSMLDNATAKKENAVLKSYFQQQGLSEDEISQAIATFKQNKQQQASERQNANANLQNEVAAAQKAAEQAQIELTATKVAMTLGIDAKTLPYVLKMADFSKIKDNDGKISEDNVKTALEQVLKDVPALKPAKENNTGFQIGAGQQQGGNNNNNSHKHCDYPLSHSIHDKDFCSLKQGQMA
ncbi:hypothetical protein ACTNBM_02045 [Lachnospiraceae bacterium HCP1S3_C3]